MNNLNLKDSEILKSMGYGNQCYDLWWRLKVPESLYVFINSSPVLVKEQLQTNITRWLGGQILCLTKLQLVKSKFLILAYSFVCHFHELTPSTPTSVQDRISPYNINTVWGRLVIRIRTIKDQLRVISWSNTKFSKLTSQELYGTQ